MHSTEKVPPDPLTLQDIARDTGGRSSPAADAQRLQRGLPNLGTRLTTKKEKQQVTSAFAGGALVLLLAGAGSGSRAAGGCREARLVPPAPERSSSEPGPGPVPPAVLRSLDLAVMRRDREPRAGRAPDAAGRRRAPSWR